MYPVCLRQVHKSYHLDAVQVAALSDINLDIRPRTFTVLSGPSGSESPRVSWRLSSRSTSVLGLYGEVLIILKTSVPRLDFSVSAGRIWFLGLR